MNSLFREEKDSLGIIKVPSKAMWGAQTQRALKNFDIGQESMPIKIIYALAKIKKAAALTNNRLGVLSDTKKELIVNASNEIIEGHHDDQFPLKIWQSGSGTQTNMNVNEVISNLVSKAVGQPLGRYVPIHPNDDVNRSQSTNDVFPAAIKIATATEILENLLPELDLLIEAFAQKSLEWIDIIKIGRTHLQEAVPLTLGQEVSAWRDQIATAKERIKVSLEELLLLPLGGTAVGTGLNTPNNFDKEITSEISLLTKIDFKSAPNKFAIMASHDDLVNTMTAIKLLSVCLFKVVNDIRILSCGPRSGFAELRLPANEPGSSIMPGKINPTQCEVMSMVCTQVIALESAVTMAGSNGQLQMNAYKPLIGFNLLKSIELIKNACKCCRTKMVNGIEANTSKIQNDLNQSLMLVTALTPTIGYDKACEIAQYAYNKNISLKEAALALKYIEEEDFNKIINPIKMANIKNES